MAVDPNCTNEPDEINRSEVGRDAVDPESRKVDGELTDIITAGMDTDANILPGESTTPPFDSLHMARALPANAWIGDLPAIEYLSKPI